MENVITLLTAIISLVAGIIGLLEIIIKFNDDKRSDKKIKQNRNNNFVKIK